jgi:predicted NAD-dependent protein-ADP-ribosyltransferase YbiA (DUF1768 family)
MVQSKINSTVNYPEINTLDPEDKEHDADLYELTIKGVECIIALGLPKFAFIEKDIVYYPVYVIKDQRVDAQIGIYEITSTQQPAVLDDDGDVDILKLGPLLLYSYVDSKYLIEKSTPTPSKVDVQVSQPDDGSSSSEEEEEEGEKEDDSESSDDEEDLAYSPLKSQDSKQADVERAAYKKTSGEKWIETYMHNKNFGIVDNEGGGDCLFAGIRDGLARAGITVTVAELREKLANEVTEDIFQGYRNMYEMFDGEMQNADREIKELTRQFKELTTRGKKTKERDVLKQITEQAKTVKEKHELAKQEKKQSKLNAQEYAFMKGVDTLDKFKAMIKTCSFWGETWAISTLERVMNVKLILFSREAYRDGDMDNVIQCGQLNDAILEQAGDFKPDRYIMLEYQGQHYTLITYKGRGSFTFKELPYDVKMKVVSRCLERNAGPFYIIKEFRDFMESINIPIPPDPAQESPVAVDEEMSSPGLISKTTIFQFYSKSANAPAPGKGSGESILPQDVIQFAELSAIPEWRRKLSNFWVAPFELDGHRWSSVEHYYQASKFKENNPQFYLTFTLDANPEGDLAKDPAIAKAAGGKTGKYKGKQVRDKAIKIDPNFFGGRHKEEMKKAQMAKFSQNQDLKTMLLATKDAKLQHFSRGSPPIVFYGLMDVRNQLAE